MGTLEFWLKKCEDEMNIHLEVIDDYLEKCIRKSFGGMMSEYGV